ncbi:MAG: hypothetical protein GVY17_13735 [Cyanobacteria bacterium]|jgi:inhibitor of cysteine peptidase|nr:hypothetical protein [Cyanobacteria bacterium GSL.Bin21]
MAFQFSGFILSCLLVFNQPVISYFPAATVFLAVDPVQGSETQVMSPLMMTEADQGKTFTVSSGNLIMIKLAENPTTGYRWAITPSDPDVVALQSSEFSLAKNAGIGSGGERRFVLQAKAPGRVTLQLKKLRSWAGEDSVMQALQLNLQVIPPEP